MEFHPVRALITRDSANDAQHESIHDAPGLLPVEPEVGVPLQMYFDSGKVMRTTRVRSIATEGSEMVVDTENSRYRLKLKAA
jgi:hypothetical protein